MKLLKLAVWVIGLMGPVFLSAGCGGQDQPPAVDPVPVEQPLDGENLELAWSYQVDGPINASPLRVGDVVIVAPVGGPLIALDVETGEQRWQYEPAGKLWERSYVTDGDRVFVGIEGGKLIALEAETGDVQWERDLGIDVQIDPHVAGEVLYVPTTFVGPGLEANPQGQARIFALAAATGEEIWSATTDNYILQTPFLQNDILFVGGSYQDPTIEVDEGGPMRLYALSAEDGSRRWIYQSEDGFMKALYATDEVVAYSADQDFASGVDTQTGELLWRKDTGNWVPSLSGTGDTVYFGSATTVVHALDMNSGEPLWKYNIGGDSFNYLLGTPVRVGNSLYFLSQQGDIIALDATDGTLQWQLETGITGARDGLTVAGGWLFIGDGEGNVYAYTGAEH